MKNDWAQVIIKSILNIFHNLLGKKAAQMAAFPFHGEEGVFISENTDK